MTFRDGICDLCGIRGPVEARVVAWLEPVFGPYENIDRCPDQEACRERIVTRGDLYPVREAAADGSRKEA